MDSMDYGKTKDNAQRRKADLLQRQQQIPLEKKRLDEELEKNKRELIGLDQILDGLDFMNSDIPPDFEPTGFTDNIRQILSETTVPLVPTQIRDALQARGITGSSPKNLLINVHKVLERIDTELKESTTPDGKTAYTRTTPWTENILLKRFSIGRTITAAMEQDNFHTLAGLAPISNLVDPEASLRAAVGRKPKAPIPPPSMRKKLGLDKD
jgi:hypothetical protein